MSGYLRIHLNYSRPELTRGGPDHSGYDRALVWWIIAPDCSSLLRRGHVDLACGHDCLSVPPMCCPATVMSRIRQRQSGVPITFRAGTITIQPGCMVIGRLWVVRGQAIYGLRKFRWSPGDALRSR